MLGICFGGQLLAAALGGSVERAPTPEIGWLRVDTDDAALVPAGPWFQWHQDRWTPPARAREVARTPLASQAFVLGRSLAVQFHPELTAAQLEGWLANGGHAWLAAHGTDGEQLLAHTPSGGVRVSNSYPHTGRSLRRPGRDRPRGPTLPRVERTVRNRTMWNRTMWSRRCRSCSASPRR